LGLKSGTTTAIILVAVLIIADLPIIPTEDPCGIGTQNESFFSRVGYFFQCLFGCLYSCPVLTVTLSSALLYAGTASYSDLQGTARLDLVLNNPGTATGIVSIQMDADNETLSMFQYPTLTYCHAPMGLIVAGNGVTAFNSTNTASYLSNNIRTNETVQYIINFENGQSIQGVLVAQ
jgi:hypothetical protein